ncbi:MAG: Ni/Fe-hydrogenase 1 B-type cytochrome subunit [Lysobacterales bacterium]|jgi:Ni/Fe-hydrogenase 1 B-type cytochrome subunit
MQINTNENSPLETHKVWDKTIRIFHWVNLASVLVLTSLGLFILYGDEFGVSKEGKVLLKTLHVYAGYVFALNLIWRLVWAFAGNKYAKWRAILPFGKGFPGELRIALREFGSQSTRSYLGHDPLGKLMIALLLLLMVSQASTGLVLAGTDVYMPPFGSAMAQWVTGGDPDLLANLKPGSKEFVDMALYDEMRAFRSPFIFIHKNGFYVLAGAIVLHIAGVVWVDARQKKGLVSAMLSGQKHIAGEPVDKPEE